MIEGIISSLLSLFKEGGAFAKARGEKRDAALDSIYMACTETKIYVTDQERGAPRDHKREHDLARLWKKAAIHVRHFDRDLAEKCYYKGEYWLNPERWSDKDSGRFKADLDRVIVEAREMKVLSDEEYDDQRFHSQDA